MQLVLAFLFLLTGQINSIHFVFHLIMFRKVWFVFYVTFVDKIEGLVTIIVYIIGAKHCLTISIVPQRMFQGAACRHKWPLFCI